MGQSQVYLCKCIDIFLNYGTGEIGEISQYESILFRQSTLDDTPTKTNSDEDVEVEVSNNGETNT